MDYAELQISSNFSFLRGASHVEEIAIIAKALDLKAFALTDRNTLAGIVRGHQAAKDYGLSFIPACRLDLQDGISLLAYPSDRAAYARLTSLLTCGNRRAPKGDCYLWLEDVVRFSKGILFALLPETSPDLCKNTLGALREQLNDGLYLAASYRYHGQEKRRILALNSLGQQARTPLLATGDILYHAPERRLLADTLACVREGVRIDTAGYLLAANAERFLKAGHEIARLFSDTPNAIRASLEIAEACKFSLDELRYNYPNEQTPEDIPPQAYLAEKAHEGLTRRFPGGIPEGLEDTLERELSIVEKKAYAPYFLTVFDIVQYARQEKILCQGRGSAANSLICFALGITDVNPVQVELLFERFISDARAEPPDIDVDFEHERREEVIQYIYRKYGRHRAGLAATTITYRARSAIRDVGKVMGLSEDTLGALAGTVWGSYGREITDQQVQEAGFEPEDKRLRQTLDLAHELVGFPRHLSQHVGGFVLTETALHDIVPIQNAAMADRTVIEWNKDDLDALEILKVDVLSLGMLTCIRKAFDLMRHHHGIACSLKAILDKHDDAATYAMLQKADTVGVFQVESRAQMSMLPRLKPREFYDLVVQVAIVRPGPIQGDMVHPYLRRRQGLETPDLPRRNPKHGSSKELESVLAKTYGVPLFQEQAMRIAIVAAGFSPLEADQLRRSMASFRNQGTIQNFHDKFIAGMLQNGYELDFAERCFSQIGGFADYGFPESHAAAFAMLAYASAWLKCHYPDVFACALLNSQPMGFYAPAQIVRDARDHGVEVRPVDINHSHWDCTLEPAPETRWRFALRLGFRQITGVRQELAEHLEKTRIRPYIDVADLHAKTRIPVNQIEKLAEGDAFRSTGLDRRQALWQVRSLVDTPALPLFLHADAPDSGNERPVTLPEMPLAEHVVNDYQTMRLSLKAHPLGFLRPLLEAQQVSRCEQLDDIQDGKAVAVSGLVLVRQRPGSAKGVIFLTLEDETGIANIVIWKKIFEHHRAIVMGSRLIIVHGTVQKQDGVIHIVAKTLTDASHELLRLSENRLTSSSQSPEEKAGQLPSLGPHRHPRDVKGLIPKSRDFH